MKKYLLLFSCIFTVASYGQVTIGSLNAPESFSTLQLDETSSPRGFRLPQMAPFTTSLDATAKGLLIYNNTDNYINYWDGTKWLGLKERPINAFNGLYGAASGVKSYKLGGTLTENTIINLNNFGLNFKTGTNFFKVNDYFSIGNNTVQAKANSVILGPNEEIKVSGFVGNTTNPNKVTIDSTLIVTDAISELTVTDTGSVYNGTLVFDIDTRSTITDAAVTATNIEKRDFIFSKNTKGEPFWAPLRDPSSPTEVGSFITDNMSLVTEIKKISKPLTLTRGTWLIFSRVPFQSTTTGASLMHLWFQILAYNTGATTGGTVIAGMGASFDDERIAIPEVLTIYEVTEESMDIYVQAGTSTGGVTLQNATLWNTYNGPEFFAILIDKPVL